MGIMNLSEIMDRSIEVLRKNVKSIIVFSLIYWIICFIAILIMAIPVGIFSVMTATMSGSATIGIAALCLVVFLGIAIAISANVGMIEICSQEFFKKKVEASDAIKLSFKNIFRVCAVILIIGIISIPVAALIYGIGRVLYMLFEGLSSSIGGYDWGVLVIAFLIILTVMLALVGIIAYLTVFAFSIQAMTIESTGIFGSIKRSWQLVRHNFWKVFGCVILFYICVTAIRLSIDSFIGLCISILFFILNFFDVPMDFISFFTLVYSQLDLPLNVMSFAIITPINTIMMTMLYFNQRIKKEGFDMRVRLREIQRKNERKQAGEFTIYNKPVQN